MSEVPDRRELDGWLVANARLGDRRAFAALVLRWQKKLLVHAWRLLRDDEAAKDSVQDAWAEIVRGLGGLKDERLFGPWAYRIVSRRCARAVRGLAARRRLAEALGAESEPAWVEADPVEDRLRTAIAGLPPGQQAAIALYHLEEMSVAEVAVALDVPAGTVKTRLMHALLKLRAALEGDE
ncbi:MAG: RNA polymerase sigma factor [Allosphingosinicella sp.]